MTDATITTTDATSKSPFPKNSNEFVVRSIKRGWNATFGRDEWHLQAHCSYLQSKDNRIVRVLENSDLFKAIVAADPRVLDMVKDTERDLLPVYRVDTKWIASRLHDVVKYAVLPLQKAEQERIDSRVHFDALNDLRVELGMGRAKADGIIRHCLGNDNWWVLAADMMRDEYAKEQAAKKPAQPALDIEAQHEQSRREFAAITEDRNVTDTTLEDELTSVAEQQAAEDKPANWASNPQELKAFWRDVNNHNNKYAQWREMGTEAQTNFARDTIGGPLHDTELGREVCKVKVIDRARTKWGEGENQNAPQTAPSKPTSQTNAANPEPRKTVPQSAPVSGTQSNGSKVQQNSKFQKATKKNSKLRLAIGGVPGGGKTYTALQIARAMFPNGKIAVLDTESGSAEKYANDFDFDVLEINDDYRPEKYIEAIAEAEAAGYDVLIIDSLSHEWSASGGILDIVDDLKSKYKNKEGVPDSRAAWRDASPRHNNLIAAILQSKIHVIATMRCKWKSIPARDENKRPISVKVIGALEQRDKVEYEFDIVALCDEHQNLTIDKSRCSTLTGYKGNKAGVEVATRISKWLEIAA